MNWRHIGNLKTNEIYHMDDRHRLWTCDCKMPADERVSLCISICDCLKDEGELREVKREIAQKRKDLGLLPDNLKVN